MTGVHDLAMSIVYLFVSSIFSNLIECNMFNTLWPSHINNGLQFKKDFTYSAATAECLSVNRAATMIENVLNVGIIVI